MITFCSTITPIDRARATPASIRTTIKPTPVTDNVTDVMIAPIKKLCQLIINLMLVFYNFYTSFSIYDF